MLPRASAINVPLVLKINHSETSHLQEALLCWEDLDTGYAIGIAQTRIWFKHYVFLEQPEPGHFLSWELQLSLYIFHR